MDNLKHTDIVICFSAISRLHEPPPSAVEEPKKPHTAGKRGDKLDLEKDTTNMTDLTIDGMLKKRRWGVRGGTLMLIFSKVFHELIL